MHYCSTCGTRVSESLSYCKSCGAKLARREKEDKPTGLRPEALIGAMTTVFVLGFICTIILMGVMKVILGLPVDQVLHLALVPVLMIAILEGIFARMLFRSTKKTQPTSEKALNDHATSELNPGQVRVLPEPLPSVTEHTTRAFESKRVQDLHD
jgi:hypothetical protein